MNNDFETAFLRARELTDPEERAAFLDAECGTDAEMRERLDAMLADAEATDRYFETPPPGSPGDPRHRGPPNPGEGPGTVIGRYRLLQRIGEGGMGSVYLAEQHEPVVRKVALKIIKLGMDTREVVARFEAERQALATMEHPGIAKVLDGGVTESGRPYFVMELVHGLPITQFCDERQLSTKARLKLFMDVCHAIQHAHQKGIIHRDIKPSNILVTLDGDRPVAKVIDFGIAKATERRLTDKTLFTQFREFIGTPAYMSPEQADLHAVDIDTRSDIYSLGVLLYELLTGKTPFETTSLLKAGLDEIRRIIRETDPPRPSTRLNTMAAEERTTVARARQTEAGKLGPFVRGDLDWIVMKALDKDRARRYESASGLAADLRRHLEGDPVLAAPPGIGYRVRKFSRRHRGGLVTAGLFVGMLMAATAISVWQAVRATRAEKAAVEGRAEAEVVSKFLVDTFRSPDPARDGRSITVAEVLERAAGKLETDLKDQPERRASMLATLGRTYNALGLAHDAIPLLEEVRERYVTQYGLNHSETLGVMEELVRSYFDVGRMDEALKLSEEVVRLHKEVHGIDQRQTLTAMSNLANVYDGTDNGTKALTLREEVLERRRKVLGREDKDTLLAMNNLSISYFDAGRRAEALKMREEVMEVSRHFPPEDLCRIRAMHALSLSWFDEGRTKEAIGLMEEAIRLRERLLGPDHSDTLGSKAYLLDFYLADGRAEDALRLSEEVLAACERVVGPKHPNTLQSMGNHAVALVACGRRDEALAEREKLLALSREVLGLEHQATLKAANQLARSYFDAGLKDKAMALREEVIGIRRRTHPPDDPDTILATEDLANSLFDAGRREEALPLREQVLAVRRRQFRSGHPDTLRALQDLATSYDAAGRSAEAAALRDEITRVQPPTVAPPR